MNEDIELLRGATRAGTIWTVSDEGQRIVDRILKALDESVKLQSHYATLLNGHDGGKRMVFISPEAWMNRLDEVRS